MISLADQSQPRGYPSLSVRIRKSYKNREVHVCVRPALRRARMGVPPRERVLPWRGYVSVSVQTDDYKSSISRCYMLLMCVSHHSSHASVLRYSLVSHTPDVSTSP